MYIFGYGLIASGSPLIRDGLRRLLESEADLNVVGETSDGAEAVKLARQLQPDILLIDLALPNIPGSMPCGNWAYAQMPVRFESSC